MNNSSNKENQSFSGKGLFPARYAIAPLIPPQEDYFIPKKIIKTIKTKNLFYDFRSLDLPKFF